MVMNSDSRSIAILIDGDNAQPSSLGQMLTETVKYGTVTVRRIYGDWTSPQMSMWKNALQSHAIQPVQQFRYTVGKNATDSALIIDAMDLLHSGNLSGFCIVSSDSDYTRLATRIREAGLFVMGIGERKTPEALVKACEVFVYLENLLSPTPQKEGVQKKPSPDWIKKVNDAIKMSEQEDGWTFLGQVGNNLRKLDPAFDPRSYGHNQLSSLVGTRPDLLETRSSNAKGGTSLIYVKMKSKN